MQEAGIIRIYGDSVLKKKCKEVTEVDKDIQKLVNVMAQAMYQHRGVGLAASQIGILRRVIVVDAGEGLIALINPKILWQKGKDILAEGCLSFPGVTLEIKRSREIMVEALNNRGEQVKLNASGVLARIIQHEVDHLDGVLIIDRVPRKRLKTISKELADLKGKV